MVIGDGLSCGKKVVNTLSIQADINITVVPATEPLEAELNEQVNIYKVDKETEMVVLQKRELIRKALDAFDEAFYLESAAH